MSFTPNWKPPSKLPEANICYGVKYEALRLVTEQMPDLADLFPFKNRFEGRVHFDEGWLAIAIEFGNDPGAARGGAMEAASIERYRAVAVVSCTPNHNELVGLLGAGYFSFTRFAYVGPYEDEQLSWPHLAEHVAEWINHCVLPEVLHRNQTRVLRTIPVPPQFDFAKTSRGLWVLECEESSRQGTAFTLAGYGIITCAHVLGETTRAFKASATHEKRPVRVVARNDVLDLAVLEIDGTGSDALRIGSADSIRQMDHIAVVGYPNYRVGDSGVLIPGLVVGFRPVSGVRRILTNAPIVAGNSGGPVIDGTNRVIGVAVTGADRMEEAGTTENHGIIPIDALGFLKGGSSA